MRKRGGGWGREHVGGKKEVSRTGRAEKGGKIMGERKGRLRWCVGGVK